MNEQLAKLQQDDPEAELRHKWVSYEQISPNLKRALIASEDAKFVDHEGFDWDGIEAAFEKNLKKGKIVAGGSTISQQLARICSCPAARRHGARWRSLDHGDAGNGAGQATHLRDLPERDRMGQRRVWRRGGVAPLHYRSSAARLSSAQAAKLAAMVPIRVITTAIVARPAWRARPASSSGAWLTWSCPDPWGAIGAAGGRMLQSRLSSSAPCARHGGYTWTYPVTP